MDRADGQAVRGVFLRHRTGGTARDGSGQGGRAGVRTKCSSRVFSLRFFTMGLNTWGVYALLQGLVYVRVGRLMSQNLCVCILMHNPLWRYIERVHIHIYTLGSEFIPSGICIVLVKKKASISAHNTGFTSSSLDWALLQLGLGIALVRVIGTIWDTDGS